MIVMDYLQGGTLRQYLLKRKYLNKKLSN